MTREDITKCLEEEDLYGLDDLAESIYNVYKNEICKFCAYYEFDKTEDWEWCMAGDRVNVVTRTEDNFGCNKFMRKFVKESDETKNYSD